MKQVMTKTIFLILIACSMAMMSNVMAAEVYKAVDEDGNVTYTDTPPSDGSKPIKLAPISVIEAPTYEQPKNKAESADDANKEMSLKSLRRRYADFAIVSPQQEESVWHPEAAMSVAWSTGYELQEGMQVTIHIDGKMIAKTSDHIIPVPGIDRGEHKVEAQLTDSKDRTIATAEAITFFVRRPGLYNRVRGG